MGSRVAALGAISGALKSMNAQAAETETVLNRTADSARRAAATVETSGKQASAAAGAAEGAVRSSAQAMTAAATSAREETGRQWREIEQEAEAAHGKVATQLDDLLARLGDNVWADELRNTIGLVQDGLISTEHLISLWGDALVDGTRVRELLAGMDLGQYRREVSDLVRDFRTGQATIEEVLGRLKEGTSLYAKELLRVIELFRQGKVTLEEVLRTIERIKRDYPDSEFADLADALEEAAQRGDL